MKTFRYTLLSSLVAILWAAETLSAQGIVFSQYRLVIKGRDVETLQACNPTSEARSFRLLLEDKQMDESGKINPMADSVACGWSLKKQVRIFPKRITLAPGECQSIQIQLKNTGVLPQGEFRSYLHFLPVDDASTHANDSLGQARQVRTAIVLRIGAAIPLIFRKDTKVEEVGIDSVRINRRENGHCSLCMALRRKGSQSVYGVLRLSTDVAGKPLVLKEVPGFAIFPEIGKRMVELDFAADKVVPDPSGKSPFTIQYIDLEYPDRSEVLAQWKGIL